MYKGIWRFLVVCPYPVGHDDLQSELRYSVQEKEQTRIHPEIGGEQKRGARPRARVNIPSQSTSIGRRAPRARPAHPTADWIANQLTEACGWEQIPRYLIRDQDRAYGEIFVRRVRSIGIRDRPTSFRSPWQNAYAERLIGSIRRECTDYIVIFGERHLRHVLLSYMGYYNGMRTHLSLNKDAPISRAAENAERIICRPILGGLHHQYGRM